jgi:hypothetical protein
MSEPSPVMCTPTTSGCGAGSNSPMDALLAVTMTAVKKRPVMKYRNGVQIGPTSAARRTSHSAW